MKRRITAVLCALMMLTVCAGCPGETAKAEEQELIYGTLTYSSGVSGSSIGDSFHYSDAWFSESPEGRNDHLALISAQLCAASDSAETAALLEKTGFSDVESRRFESEDRRDCAYRSFRKQSCRHS